FKPRELVELKFDRNGAATGGPGGPVTMMRTSARPVAPAGGGGSFGVENKSGYATRPAGNAVDLEGQMLKVSANQLDYAAATQLYPRSLTLLKTAVGKR
ncbi:flagellar basal body rod protein FlgB, partial [Acinetobacter baumannii]|uniref:flagellar basal body rod protein FlgB n=1 Tax=Acinetobacter baumannii TaxID=470 RepID=UPI0009AAD774